MIKKKKGKKRVQKSLHLHWVSLYRLEKLYLLKEYEGGGAGACFRLGLLKSIVKARLHRRFSDFRPV